MADACLEGSEARQKNLQANAEGSESEAPEESTEVAEAEAAPAEAPNETPAAAE